MCWLASGHLLETAVLWVLTAVVAVSPAEHISPLLPAHLTFALAFWASEACSLQASVAAGRCLV